MLDLSIFGNSGPSFYAVDVCRRDCYNNGAPFLRYTHQNIYQFTGASDLLITVNFLCFHFVVSFLRFRVFFVACGIIIYCLWSVCQRFFCCLWYFLLTTVYFNGILNEESEVKML